MAGPTTPVLEPVIVDEAFHVTFVRRLHIACCAEDLFLCGAQWHPEIEATEEHSEDDACPECVDIRYELLCPPQRPTHQHCPFRGGKRCDTGRSR